MAESKVGEMSIGFVGAGQMATALIGGLINAGVVPASQVYASDASQAALQALADTHGINVCHSNVELVQRAQIIVLAVKPGIVPKVLVKAVHDALTKDHLVVSIAAGVTLSTIESLCPPSTRVVRVMPNTPALVSCGASAYALGSHATGGDGDIVNVLLSAIGVAHMLPEKNINAVTGLSGSGPAYIFVLIEALADGGVRSGLPRHVAQSLAAQTVLGAAKMVLDTGKHPAQLKDAVASPGGTTIAGLHALEQAGFRSAVINAVVAASERADQMSKM